MDPMSTDPFAQPASTAWTPQAQPAPIASAGQRVKGWLVDWLLIGAVVGLVFRLVRGWTHLSDSWVWGTLTGLVELLVNGAILAFLCRDGQTPGRRWARTCLVDAQGRPVQAGMPALPRYLCHVLDNLPLGIGWLVGLLSKSGQTFADRIAHTTVVDLRQSGVLPR